jgi:hypothetical protein
MRIALDTNILAYAEDVGDDVRCNAAIHLIERLPAEKVLLPAQTLGELSRVLTGKAGKEAKALHTAVLEWADAFEVADSSWSSFQSAFDLVVDHHMQMRQCRSVRNKNHDTDRLNNNCCILRLAAPVDGGWPEWLASDLHSLEQIFRRVPELQLENRKT